MLEGKELDKKLGEVGNISVDINDKLQCKVELSVGDSHGLKGGLVVELDLIAELEKVGEKSPAIKTAVGVLKGLLGA